MKHEGFTVPKYGPITPKKWRKRRFPWNRVVVNVAEEQGSASWVEKNHGFHCQDALVKHRMSSNRLWLHSRTCVIHYVFFFEMIVLLFGHLDLLRSNRPLRTPRRTKNGRNESHVSSEFFRVTVTIHCLLLWIEHVLKTQELSSSSSWFFFAFHADAVPSHGSDIIIDLIFIHQEVVYVLHPWRKTSVAASMATLIVPAGLWEKGLQSLKC